MRIIICDDNPNDIKEYSEIINNVIVDAQEEDMELIAYESVSQLLFDMEDKLNLIDIMILDINMPGTNGMEFAKSIRENSYKGEIIFLTWSKDHMPGAFDVRAFNYIVKGETDVKRVEKIILGSIDVAKEKTKEYMLFTGIGEYRNIPVLSIKYFEVNGKIITVHYSNRSFEFVSTIGKLENLLFSKGFIRVHRSFMVAISAIKNFTYTELTLVDGVVIPVGRTYYNKLKKAITKTVV